MFPLQYKRKVGGGGSIRADKLNPSMRNKWIKKTYFAVINDFYIIKRSNIIVISAGPNRLKAFHISF